MHGKYFHPTVGVNAYLKQVVCRQPTPRTARHLTKKPTLQLPVISGEGHEHLQLLREGQQGDGLSRLRALERRDEMEEGLS